MVTQAVLNRITAERPTESLSHAPAPDVRETTARVVLAGEKLLSKGACD